MTSTRLVLLDVDGTLVDSNDAHASAWVEAFRVHGRDVEYARVRRLIGKGGDKLIPEVTGVDPESAEGKSMSDARARIFKAQYLPRIRAFDGARELVERIVDEGWRVGVASSAPKDELRELLRRADVSHLISGSSSADDADHSKPDPDIVKAALDRLDARPNETILIGDTPYDVEAADRAGVRAIGMLTGGWTREALSGAMFIASDPRDLFARWDESPLASGQRRSSQRMRTSSARTPH